MITTVLSDFSYVLLFPKAQSYKDTLNGLYRQIIGQGKYNLFDYYVLNQELLKFYKSIRDEGISVNIFTAGVMQNDPQLRSYLGFFDQIISAQDHDLSKADTESYRQIAKKLSKSETEIVFVDDSMLNVTAATEAGLTGLCYKNNSQIISELKSLLS